MYELDSLLKNALGNDTSDIFIIAGYPPSYKIGGRILPQGEELIMPDSAEELIRHIYATAGRAIEPLLTGGDDDFAFALPGLSRFRVSTYKQRGSLAAVIRVVPFGIPDPADYGIPPEVIALADRPRGLVLVTGPAGSGKSTTQACMIDHINATRSGHIITLEEPLEFLHRDKHCIISQREIELDTGSYAVALRACLRQAPDVILLGEMRDLETIRTAMTAAETGHLIISTLHTLGAANTIDRVIDIFPPNQQQQIRVQLAMLLQSVVSQQLLPTVDGGIVPVFEIMHVNNAVRTMIREAKVHQLDSLIQSSAAEGMRSMDAGILELYRQGRITRDTALTHAANAELMAKRLGN